MLLERSDKTGFPFLLFCISTIRKNLCTGFILGNYNVRKLQISLHCFPTAYISSAYSHLYVTSEIKRDLSTSVLTEHQVSKKLH